VDPDPYWESGSGFEKEVVFKSSVLAWIRIELKLIRIHNPVTTTLGKSIIFTAGM
jgi:hypothetical protein